MAGVPCSVDLAIVTNVRNYGHYLGEWADSILALTRTPAQVVLIEHGSTDGSAAHVEAAAARLRAAGIQTVAQSLPGALDFGSARNAAVALAPHEWILHLDADDSLMPHALEDLELLAPGADVVQFGYVRTGDLAAGPPRPSKLYHTGTGSDMLVNPTPASGCSPFRRALWEQRPYVTDQVGGWDTALWLGFAHLGARFRPTRRPCFWYRQHADSLFNVRRTGYSWEAALTGQQLEGRRRGDSGVTIVVPRATVNEPERNAAWAWLQRRFAALFPDWQVVEGVAIGGPGWMKGRAVGNAMPHARGRILVIHDADVALSADALREAVRLVETRAAPWVVPLTTVYRLGAGPTARYLAGDPTRDVAAPDPTAELTRAPYRSYPGGGCVVVPRAQYVATGGIPEAFSGWGAEDECLALILDTMLGAHQRLDGPLLHLWHPPAEVNGRPYNLQGNRALLRQYLPMRGDPARLWPVLSGGMAGRAVSAFVEPSQRYRTLAQHAGDPHAAEMTMHDDFARRRLARVQQEATTMGGALEMAREDRRRQRAEMNERNVAAAADLAARREEAFGGQKMQGPAANKMMPAAANKGGSDAATALSDGEPGDHRALDPGADGGDAAADAGAAGAADGRAADGDPLAGVPFASPAAHEIAAEKGMTAAHFTGKTPSAPRGFTAADVRALGFGGGPTP